MLAFLILFFIYYVKNMYCCGPENQANNAQIQQNEVLQKDYTYLVNFSFDNDDIISVKYPYTFSPDKDLLTITQDLAEQQNWEFIVEDYGEMGVLVTKIDAKQNGQDQKYWQYFVDEKQPLISADKYIPAQGEVIDWKFIRSEF